MGLTLSWTSRVFLWCFPWRGRLWAFLIASLSNLFQTNIDKSGFVHPQALILHSRSEGKASSPCHQQLLTGRRFSQQERQTQYNRDCSSCLSNRDCSENTWVLDCPSCKAVLWRLFPGRETNCKTKNSIHFSPTKNKLLQKRIWGNLKLSLPLKTM